MNKSLILKLDNIYSSYGNVQVLNGVNLLIRKGEIVSLLGRNGMGKTTTIKSICGILKPHSGKIEFNSVKINGMESYKIARLGIGLVPEGRRIFANLTVKENLIGSSIKGYWDLDKILTLFPIFKERLSQLSSNLSGGEQQMLAIGRALMSKPKVLLLDEPSLGIAPKLVNQIFVSIKNINKEKNVTIFLVEQNAKKALELADRAYVLVNGKVTIKGPGQELLKNKDIQAAYLEGGSKN